MRVGEHEQAVHMVKLKRGFGWCWVEKPIYICWAGAPSPPPDLGTQSCKGQREQKKAGGKQRGRAEGEQERANVNISEHTSRFFSFWNCDGVLMRC